MRREVFVAMALKPASKALARFKVLDLTRARSGPTAVRQLADWGASVIKIEMPGDAHYSDPAARHGPDFQNLHRNKRSMTLDLKNPDGVKIFKRMATDADVIVENYRPDVKTRLGIDYETMKDINPRLVYASISGFGQDGPYSKRPGLDPIVQGMGGHMMVTGEPGRGPMRSGAAISDVTAGLLCANGVLTALLEREVSGEGQWIDTSLVEALIFLLDFQAARWTMKQELPKQLGNNHPTHSPMGVFKTKDGHVTLAPMPAMWPKFCEALGAPALINREEFKTADLRYQNRPDLNAEVDAVTATRDTQDWVESMNAAGIPCGPIYALDQTFEDPQIKHLGIAQTVQSPELGPTTLIGQPVRLSRTPNRMESASPAFGEHTAEILTAIGYGTEEIASLRDRGVI
jgi:crotonobetainyl-CoA:carnitine CoA-transferase CaiB-like acyl-CoA transferase